MSSRRPGDAADAGQDAGLHRVGERSARPDGCRVHPVPGGDADHAAIGDVVKDPGVPVISINVSAMITHLRQGAAATAAWTGCM